MAPAYERLCACLLQRVRAGTFVTCVHAPLPAIFVGMVYLDIHGVGLPGHKFKPLICVSTAFRCDDWRLRPVYARGANASDEAIWASFPLTCVFRRQFRRLPTHPHTYLFSVSRRGHSWQAPPDSTRQWHTPQESCGFTTILSGGVQTNAGGEGEEGVERTRGHQTRHAQVEAL